MHRFIEDGLEDYLAGRVRRDFETHLSECEPCREEVREISSLASVLHEAFESSHLVAQKEEVAPFPGFYARLSANLEERKAASPWNIFRIDAIFGKRIAFASLLTLALVGGFLVSHESDSSLDLTEPEAIIAQHDAQSDQQPDAAVTDTAARDRMMVTLASYER